MLKYKRLPEALLENCTASAKRLTRARSTKTANTCFSRPLCPPEARRSCSEVCRYIPAHFVHNRRNCAQNTPDRHSERFLRFQTRHVSYQSRKSKCIPGTRPKLSKRCTAGRHHRPLLLLRNVCGCHQIGSRRRTCARKSARRRVPEAPIKDRGTE